MNGLDDKTLTRRLYGAAAAGVRVDAIVRGICRLRAGVPGLSGNIRSVELHPLSGRVGTASYQAVASDLMH